MRFFSRVVGGFTYEAEDEGEARKVAGDLLLSLAEQDTWALQDIFDTQQVRSRIRCVEIAAIDEGGKLRPVEDGA